MVLGHEGGPVSDEFCVCVMVDILFFPPSGAWEENVATIVVDAIILGFDGFWWLIIDVESNFECDSNGDLSVLTSAEIPNVDSEDDFKSEL